MKVIFILFFVFLLEEIVAAKRPRLAARIINGNDVTEANRANYAHQVFIQPFENGDPEPDMCGGALIDSCWVLTAAHCLQHSDYDWRKGRDEVILADYANIYSGLINLEDSRNGAATCRTSNKTQYYFAPEYDEYRQKNDLALIKLTQSITPVPGRIATLMIPDRQTCNSIGSFINKTGTISGWGFTDHNILPDVLKTAQVKGHPFSLCQHHYGGGKRYDENDKLCVLGDNFERSCSGDSGGPMTMMHANQRILIGTLSSGPEKCSEKQPSVYSNLCEERFSNWILETIRESGGCSNQDVPQLNCPQMQRH